MLRKKPATCSAGSALALTSGIHASSARSSQKSDFSAKVELACKSEPGEHQNKAKQEQIVSDVRRGAGRVGVEGLGAKRIKVEQQD